MQNASPPTLHPALLPPGTIVGSWRIVDWAGCGVHGAVYRAVPVAPEQAEPVALKIALLPNDPRFAREVALLSRTHHPSIPRLYGHGQWQHPNGSLHPFIAMQWVDGIPLYDWARLHPHFHSQVPRLLAQLARALQALHSQGGIHRDVKGDNVLVRRSDGRAMLIDFGLGSYSDAPSLTPQLLPPATPAYRAPEAGLFAAQFGRNATAPYRAGPTDDLYALAVTACRLLTGKYPELGEPTQDEHGTWRLKSMSVPSALLRDPRIPPQLRALILRTLSVHPQERSTAGQLAVALEQLAESLLPSPQNSGETLSPHAHARRWRPHLITAAAGLALAMWAWWVAPATSEQNTPRVERRTAEAGRPDAGPSGLGDAVSSASTLSSPEPSASGAVAKDTPPEPQQGQARPDAKGRCPHRWQITFNGGCWRRLKLNSEECAALSGSLFKGECYVPVFPSGRPPTTSPSREQ